MKILFDQGTPVPLKNTLTDHIVATAYDMNWSALTNGDLLAVAEVEHFEVLVTTDKNLRYQQNLSGRKIAIFVLPFTSWPKLKVHATLIATAIGTLSKGSYVEWSAP